MTSLLQLWGVLLRGTIRGMSSERDGLDPALRVNVGELILNGNTFSDSETTLMFFLDEATRIVKSISSVEQYI